MDRRPKGRLSVRGSSHAPRFVHNTESQTGNISTHWGQQGNNTWCRGQIDEHLLGRREAAAAASASKPARREEGISHIADASLVHGGKQSRCRDRRKMEDDHQRPVACIAYDVCMIASTLNEILQHVVAVSAR